MRVLNFVMSAVSCLASPFSAAAEEPLFLVDRSGSTALMAAPIIEGALLELEGFRIEIVLWNVGVTGTIWGNAEDLVRDLPLSSGRTYLGKALGEYSRNMECRHLIVLVDGRANDMSVVRAAAEEILERNRLTILVITTRSSTLREYKNISDSEKYSAMTLVSGVVYDVYQLALSEDTCVLNLS